MDDLALEDIEWRSLLDRYGPYAVLVAVGVFMFWVRTKPADRVITDGVVFFSGNDPWYHSRIIQLAANNFLSTPGFDPWSQFPYGTGRHSGFGGLFDQLIALAALIVGGGGPSEHLINVVAAYAPPVFGALTIVPLYFIARRMLGRWGALLPVGLLSLASGQFLSRTIIGTADHQSAEAFFGTLAFFGFLYAVEHAYIEKPTLADIQDRNWRFLRAPAIAALLGGVLIASYLMMWPPGVVFVFTMGVFVVLQGIADYLSDVSLEYIAFGTGVSMLTTTLLTLGYAKSYGLQPTSFSLLQPLVAIGIGIGGVVLYALAEYWRDTEYRAEYYPVAVFSLIAATLLVASAVYPPTVRLIRGLVGRIYSFGLLTTPSALTVAEIQPANLQSAWQAFGPVFYVAVLGGLILLGRLVRDRRPAELLVLLWSFTTFSAYFTSIRFGYYTAVNVALLAGFAIWWTGRSVLNLDADFQGVEDLEAYQIIGVIIILVAVVPGNVVAVQDRQPVWETADRFGGFNQAWYGELTWMQNNTPEEPLDYTQLYQAPEDGDFEYPPDAYGVMSWWDYGHWITTIAHRIPNANPFQEGPRRASAYFQAQNETRANLILEALSATDNGTRIAQASNAELRELIASQSDQQQGEETRYVVIDDQMAAYSPGKFRPIATWTGPGRDAYVARQEVQLRTGQQGGQGEGQTATLLAVNDRYKQMMLYKLYFGDTRGLNHYRLVHESSSQSTFVSVARRTSGGAYRSTGFINGRLSQRIFNAVQSNPSLAFYDVRRAASVKVFERVPGATLVGSVDTNNQTVVFATVRLQSNTGRNFTYSTRTLTDTNGDFNLTVPYATNDAIGPGEGGTDSGVTALGNYTLFAGNPFVPQSTGNTSVPESAIYEGETVRVEMSPPPQQQQNVSVNRSGSGNQSAVRVPTIGGATDDAGPVDGERGLVKPPIGADASAPRRAKAGR